MTHTDREAHFALMNKELRTTFLNIVRANAALTEISNATHEISRLLSCLPTRTPDATNNYLSHDFDLERSARHMIDAAKCAQSMRNVLTLLTDLSHIFGETLCMQINHERELASADILPFPG